MYQSNPPKQPILLAPAVIQWLVGITVLFHLIMVFGPIELRFYMLKTLAFIPVRFSHPELMQIDLVATIVSPAGYALLHGSWSHLLINMAMLFAFGTPLVRLMGTPFFLTVYIFGSLAGAASVCLLAPESETIVIGASAGVSAVLGALVGTALSGYEIPSHPQSTLFHTRKKTLTFLLVWVVINVLFGVLPGEYFGVEGRIAWEAHLGGLIIGILLALIHIRNLRRAIR